jgi:hypothetical protein
MPLAIPRRKPKAKGSLVNLKKPSKRVVFITGVEKPTKAQLALVGALVDWLVENVMVIVTTDRDGIDAEVVRRTNKHKYDKIVVWGCSGGCRYMPNFGFAHGPHYQAAQRDDVCVARTGTSFFIGKDKRMPLLIKFARDIGRSVREK